MNPDKRRVEPVREDLPSDNDLRVYAGRLLARREYAVQELHARLVRKWPELAGKEHRVGELMESLQQEGSLSDRRFAESFIRSRRRRYNGPVKIQSELRQRLVPDEVIAGLLDVSDDAWVGLASAWLSHQSHEPLDFSARAKYYRRLVNRGFSHQQAMQALNSREKA